MKLIDIHSPQDIKPLTIDDLKDLAKQMRAAIINYTSTIGGHVGPNLGDVEALIGVHYVFDAPKDKIVIDVSHQDSAMYFYNSDPTSGLLQPFFHSLNIFL